MHVTRREFLQAALGTGAVLAIIQSASQPRSAIGTALGQEQTSARIGFVGSLTDILTGRPVAGARVWVDPSAEWALSDENGRYFVAAEAGVYAIHVEAAGYLATLRTDQAITKGISRQDFALLPERVEPGQEAELYEKVVRSPQSPLIYSLAPQAPSPGLSAQAISLPCQIAVDFGNGDIRTMDMEEYLKHVVPYEMPASWPLEALKAQAVAARSYALAYLSAHTSICITTACQVYGPNRYPSTDAAVDATRGQVLIYNGTGTIISALYHGSCNGVSTKNSEDAIDWRNCARLGWYVVPYLRARSCTVHGPYPNTYCGYFGHGVGLCQIGALHRAANGADYRSILMAYYTNVSLVTGAPACTPTPTRTPTRTFTPTPTRTPTPTFTPTPTPTPTNTPRPDTPMPLEPRDMSILPAEKPIVFSWFPIQLSGSYEYQVHVQDAETYQETAYSPWLSSLTWSSPPLPLGAYTWYVGGRPTDGSGTVKWSENRRFSVAHLTYFPLSGQR